MHACMKWVCSFKALHQTVYIKVRNGITINYIQTMAKYYVFRLLVCDVCVGSKALSIPGGLILYLFKQLLEER